MRTNTLVTLGASAVFGIMAIVLARGWIEGAVEDEFRQRPSQSSTPISLEVEELVQTTPVLIANYDLAFGDVLTPEAVRVVDMPDDAIPGNVFNNIEDIFHIEAETFQAEPLIVLDDIRMNEIILPHRISAFNEKASLSARIKTGYRAISIEVDDVTGVSGFIIPGDLVDIQYLSIVDPKAKKPIHTSDILLQSVKVLGIDQSHDPQNETIQVARTVTLEVSHVDAQTLAIAQASGTLSLALRAVGETMPATTTSVNTAQLSTGKTASSQTSRRSKYPTQVSSKKPPSSIAEIKIIRGDTTQSVSVRREAVEQKIDLELAGG